jgi:hypothetical protein
MQQELNGMLKYLEGRGFVVGKAVVAPDGLQISILNRFLPTDRVRLLAELEKLKDDRAAVDGDGLAFMAQLCKKISEHPSLDSRSADEARDLERRVSVLQNPPDDHIPTEAEIAQIPIQANVLRIRMAHLLTREFPLLWN